MSLCLRGRAHGDARGPMPESRALYRKGPKPSRKASLRLHMVPSPRDRRSGLLATGAWAGGLCERHKKNPHNCNVAGSLLSLRQSTYSAWCRGRDLNPHGIATAPSRQRVYQFHHLDNEKNVYSALRKKASKKCEFLKNIFLAGNPEWLETGWRTVPCALCLPLWAGSRGDRAPIPARSSECPRPGDS